MNLQWLVMPILAAASLSAPAAPPGAQQVLLGRWGITGVADAQQTTSLSSGEADLLKGRDFIVSAEAVLFDGESCMAPTFQQSRHATATFFRREYRMDPNPMRLPDPVSEIEIACRQPSPISYVYMRDQRHIVIFWRGFFLNAEKR